MRPPPPPLRKRTDREPNLDASLTGTKQIIRFPFPSTILASSLLLPSTRYYTDVSVSSMLGVELSVTRAVEMFGFA